ncbi:MAG: radical SAM protein [Candidatus Melainabacteria bacterium]|nr:radical SAM protein [Candidatus Melainabacteria bacterium]
MFKDEIRLVPKPFKTSPDIKVAWCFPHDYSIGMSGLGYQLVYHLLDSAPDVDVTRVFKDCQENGANDCELFGFTVSWELDFINILTMLKAHGVAWLSKDRDDNAPLVFGGGPVLSANPETFAEIFDVILLGDAEETIPKLLEAVRESSGMTSRFKRLEHFAKCPGIYVPSLYAFEYDGPLGPITAVKTLSDSAPPHVSKLLFRAKEGYVAHSIILSPDTTWGDTFLLEVARSCPQECRFCLASYLTRPFRTAPVSTILEKVDMARRHTNKFGLMGPSITEHPEFDLVLDGLLEREGLNVSVASVRADTLTTELVSKLRALGSKSVTIALESGSERLRRIMSKNLTEPQVLAAVDAIECGGMSAVKFYGISGLPYETDEDVDETIRLLTQLKRSHKKLRFVFGVTSFVPKAQTPYQWKGRDRSAKAKIEHMRKNLAKIGIDIRPESSKWSDIQGLLSRGDRRLTPVLLNVATSGETLGAWRKALRDFEESVPSIEYYAYRDIDEAEILPWGHVANEAKSPYLARQLAEAGLESQK